MADHDAGHKHPEAEQRIKSLEEQVQKLQQQIRDLQQQVKTHDHPHSH